jgi:hypothetical protein
MKISTGLRSARCESIHSWLISIASKSFQMRASSAQLYWRHGAGRCS